MATVKGTDLIVANVLEQPYSERIYNTFAQKWDPLQSLGAAMKLMEDSSGVKLSPQEEKKLSSMAEADMIEALVKKMPNQTKEQFQQFFLQLQVIVTTAQHVKHGLEQGDRAIVEEALVAAENAGLSSYVLKPAVITAGREVLGLKARHDAWVKDSEHRMSKLVRGQQDALGAKKRLAAVQVKLKAMKLHGNSKVKKVLLTLFKGNTVATLKASFFGWRRIAGQERMEREIYSEFKTQYDSINQQLLEFRKKHCRLCTSALGAKAASDNLLLMEDVFNIWREDLDSKAFELKTKEQLAELQRNLDILKEAKKQSIKKLLFRMQSADEASLLRACFTAFCMERKENQLLQSQEAAAAKLQRKRDDLMNRKKNDGCVVMKMMINANENGLKEYLFRCWVEEVKEAQVDKFLANENLKAGKRIMAFNIRNKANAGICLEKVQALEEHALLIKTLCTWKITVKVETLQRFHLARIEGKKAQLGKVQVMFRDFAAKLDKGLNQGNNNDVDLLNLPPRVRSTRKTMAKNDGSVSLPNIHPKPVPRLATSEGEDWIASAKGSSMESPYAQTQKMKPGAYPTYAYP